MKQLPVTNPSFIKLQEGFKEWMEVLGYVPENVYNLPTQLREFFYFLESKSINDIEQAENETVYDYLEYLKHRKNARRGGTLSNNTLNRRLQGVKLFTQYLREVHKKSFATDILSLPPNTPPATVLSIHEVQQLYDCAGNDARGLRDNIMLDIYYGCGLRRKEGIKLDTSDILFDRQLIYVRAGKNHTERYVPASKKILQNLQAYLQEVRPSFKVNTPNETALFISAKGRRAEGQTLFLRLKQLQQKTDNDVLKKKTIGLHTLRHSIATHLLMGGMKLENIAKFLGHKSIESTQIYTHLAHELHSIP